MVYKPKKKKILKSPNAIAYINSTFNNTIITITDETGNTICWASAGSCGFKGTKKGTPFAAQITAEQVVRKALSAGVRSVSVLVKGVGPGRDTAIRALQITGLNITLLKDITPIPHNGCRPPKPRRV